MPSSPLKGSLRLEEPEETISTMAESTTSGIQASRSVATTGKQHPPPSIITRATSPPRKSDAQPGTSPSSPGKTTIVVSSTTPTPTSTTTPSPSQQQSQKQPIVPQWECDYDKSPTDLYQAIEAKEWDFVLGMFAEGVSDVAAASVHKQTATWVVRKEDSGKLRWRLLPLHAACIFQAPSLVIKLLLDEFPQSAAAKDDQGMLPLHLAFRQQPMNFTVLEELMTAYPAAATIKDRRGRTPLQAVQSPTEQQDTTAAANDGNNKAASVANAGAPASVISLYSQIVLAAAKQEWTLSQKMNTDQRLQSVAEEHAVRWTQIKTDFSLQVDQMKGRMEELEMEKKELQLQCDAERIAHENVISKSQEQLVTSQTQLQEFKSAPPTADSSPSVPIGGIMAAASMAGAVGVGAASLVGKGASVALAAAIPTAVQKEDHSAMEELVETLLEQQSALVLNLENMSTELKGQKDERAKLLELMGALDISGPVGPTADVFKLKTQVEETHKVVSDRLANISAKYKGDALDTLGDQDKDAAKEIEAAAFATAEVDTVALAKKLNMTEEDIIACTRIPTPSKVTTVVAGEKKDIFEEKKEAVELDIMDVVAVSHSEDAGVEAVVESSTVVKAMDA